MADQPIAETPSPLRARSFLRDYLAIVGSPRKTIVFGIGLLALLGSVDVTAGPSIKLTCFYLIPAFLLTWFLGRRWGYAVAVVYAAVSWAADVHGSVQPVSTLLFWNAAVRLATFVVVTVMFDICRNLTREIEGLVEAKTRGLQREIRLRGESEEAIHKLASQLSAAEDAQRRRLGHDLHDTLSQNLTVLKLQLEDFMREASGDAGIQNRLGSSLSLLDALIRQTRTLTFELYPSMLDDLGLVATLRRYAEQLESQTTVSVTISESEAPMDLPSPVRAFLFRAIKELITNAIKHGKAHEILIYVRWRDKGVRIVVDDDGTGCAPDLPLNPEIRTGIGLVAIAERLRFFGGTLRIESAQQQGLRAMVDLPLQSQPNASAERRLGGKLKAVERLEHRELGGLDPSRDGPAFPVD